MPVRRRSRDQAVRQVADRHAPSRVSQPAPGRHLPLGPGRDTARPCCSARGLRADRRDKLLKRLDTGGSKLRAEQHCRGRRRRLRLEPARSGARSGGTSRAALYRPLARPRSSATRDPARDLRRRRAAAPRAGRGPVRRTWAAPGVSHRAPARSRIPTLQTGPSGDANFGADSHPLNCLQIGNFRRLAGPLQRPVPHNFPSGPPRRAAAPGGLGSA